jgi:hypothetical protein
MKKVIEVITASEICKARVECKGFISIKRLEGVLRNAGELYEREKLTQVALDQDGLHFRISAK